MQKQKQGSTRIQRVILAIAFFGVAASSPASAYHFFEAHTGGCKWTSIGPGNVDFLVDKSSSDTISDSLLTEATAGRDRWNDITTAKSVLGNFTKSAADFTEMNFGTAWGIGFAATGPAATPDGQQEIVIDETGNIFRDTYGLDPADVNGFGPSKRVVSGGSCTITDALLLLNGTRMDFDRASTTVHEFGHIQGLAHSSVGQFNSRNNTTFTGGFGSPSEALNVIDISNVPTMHPFSSGTGSARQTPERDDMAGFSELYPEPTHATDNGVITGTVRQCIDDSPLEGVNVRVVSTASAGVQVTRYTAFDSNGEGRYRIEGLPPGSYRVIIEPMGLNGFTKSRMAIETRTQAGFATEYYGPTIEAENLCSEPSPDTPLDVVVTAGATTANIDLRVGGADLVFVVDDTGSMSQEISAVASILNDFVNTLEASSEEFPKVAIITYKDNVTFRIGSNVPAELRAVIATLFAGGGGDCPESANAALMVAGKVLRSGGVALLFTDADSRSDGPTRGMVQDFYRARSLTLSVLLSATCSRSFTASGLRVAAATLDTEALQCTPDHSDQECYGLTSLPEPGAEDEFAEPDVLGFEDAIETYSEIASETGGIFQATPRPVANTPSAEAYINFGVNMAVSSVLPAVGNVAPGDAPQGSTLDAVITGSNTNWGSASTVVFEPGVTVNSRTVNSPTSITVELAVSGSAAVDFYDVTVTTPLGGGETEVAVGIGAFRVRAPAGPEVISVVPGTGAVGETVDADVRAFSTTFDGTSTVSFGSGIAVNSVMLEDATSLRVNLTIAPDATIGFRTVNVTTGVSTAQQIDGYLVTTLPSSVPRIAAILPSSSPRGQTLEVTVTGENTAFEDGESVLSFSGTGVGVTSSSVNSPTELEATIEVSAGAELGFRDVQVETADESAVLLDGFSVGGDGGSSGGVVLALPPDGKIEGCVGPGSFVQYVFNVPEPFTQLQFNVRGRRAEGEGALHPNVGLIPPLGHFRALEAAPDRGGRAERTQVGLPMAGDYFLHLDDSEGEGGCFSGRVKMQEPSGDKRKAEIDDCLPEGGEATLGFDGFAGQRLTAKLRGEGLRRPRVTVVAPSGAMTEFRGSKLKVGLKGFPIDETGRYRLVVGDKSGFGGCFGAKLRVKGLGDPGDDDDDDEEEEEDPDDDEYGDGDTGLVTGE